MAYKGWFQLGGLEFVNAARVAAYARSLVPQMAPKCKECDTLAITLGDGEYTTPMIDQPDWYDPDSPDSWNFCGFYPLSVSGIEDDTRQASVVESVQEGGTIGRVRRATKEVRFTGLLMAVDESSLDLGMEWLKNILNGNACRDPGQGCSGDELCFLSACPDYVVGAVDPDAQPVTTELNMTNGWQTTNGTWINGLWNPLTLPAMASGPEYNPPCDDVTYEWSFATAGSEQVVRMWLLGEDGGQWGDTGEVRLRRTNYLPNPTFRDDTTGWAASDPNVTLTAQNDQGLFTTTADIPAEGGLGATAAISLPDNGPWSARASASLTQASNLQTLLVRPYILASGGNLVVGQPVRLFEGEERLLQVNNVTGTTASFGIQVLEEAISGTEVLVFNALLERGATTQAYFDGSVAPDGYSSEWLGASNSSPSRIMRTDPVLSTAPVGSGPIRPQIEALYGDEFDITGVSILHRPLADPEDCLDGVLRRLRNVTCTSGPTIIERFNTCQLGGAMWRVEFTLTAGSPWIYHIIPTEFSTVEVGDPDGNGGNGNGGTRFEPKPGIVPTSCDEQQPIRPLNDPDCPLPPSPPRPPLPDSCGVMPATYFRRAVGIPGDVMGPWQQGVPVVRLRTLSNTAARQVRVRFYPNPLERTSLDDLEECGYCGEFIVSYMPGNAELVIDGMTQTAQVFLSGDRVRNATHLLYATDGGPMIWPLLTCGIPYIMTLDTAPTSTILVASEMQVAVRS